jgi:hypothetical protein
LTATTLGWSSPFAASDSPFNATDFPAGVRVTVTISSGYLRFTDTTGATAITGNSQSGIDTGASSTATESDWYVTSAANANTFIRKLQVKRNSASDATLSVYAAPADTSITVGSTTKFVYSTTTDHWYQFSTASAMNQATARTNSTSKASLYGLSGYLARVESSSENGTLAAMSSVNTWIDGSDAAVEGTWKFSNGDSVSYTNWASGEPNNSGDQDCIQFYDNGTWDDLSCSGTLTAYFTEYGTTTHNPYSQSISATITKESQTLTLTSLGSISSKTFPETQALNASVTKTGTGAVTYSIASGGSATGCALSNSSNTATISSTSAGTCNIRATIATDNNYASATSGTLTFTFSKASQTISISSLGTATKAFPYSQALSASTSGSSGTGAVTYAITAGGNASNCALSDSSSTATLSASSSGTCYVSATIATDTNYLAATSSTSTFTFTKASQIITLSSLGISSKDYPFSQTLSASTMGSSGGGLITYAIAAGGNASGCALSTTAANATISATSIGTCRVIASIASDVNYEAATSSYLEFTFNLATQSINLSSLGTSSKSYPYSQALSMSTSGSSGTGAITYAIAAGGSATSCALSNSSASATITASTSGTCLVSATIASDTYYNSATSSALTFTFNKAAQSALSITTITAPYGNPLTLATSGGSGDGLVTYVYAEGTTTCTLSSGVLTAAATGTCLVTATKATDENYTAISSSQTTITFTAGSTTATITLADGSLVFRQAKLLTASASVVGKVTFRVNNKILPGCKNKSTTGSAPNIIATCSYRPSTRGFVTITVTLNPTDPSYIGTVRTSDTYFVLNRTGARGR